MSIVEPVDESASRTRIAGVGSRASRPPARRRSILAALVMALSTLPLVSLAATSAEAADCTVSAKLVNSCRPWLGAWAAKYPQVGSGFTSQITYHEARIGRQLDVVHQYHVVGSNVLSGEEIAFARRPGTILYTNWKPAARWADGTGANATVNANIDRMANSIASIGSQKILLTVAHEPEDDASSLPMCTTTGAIGNSGVAADYRAMWQNVRNRFDALGVTNVVWVMNYMGYPRWDCTLREFWPGNDLVDWVTFDLYPTGTATFDSTVVRFYNVLVQQSDASHDFLSKPWGLGEFGVRASSQATATAFYAAMRSAVVNNTLPQMKLFMPFDTKATYDNRLMYTSNGVIDQNEQTSYNLFANDPTMNGAWTLEPEAP